MILILMYYRHAFCLRLETHFVQLRRFLHQSQDICNNLPAPERVDQGGCAVLHWLAGFQRTLLLCGPSFRCKYALHLLRKWPVPFLNLSERWHALRFLKALGLYIKIYNIFFLGYLIFDTYIISLYIYIYYLHLYSYTLKYGVFLALLLAAKILQDRKKPRYRYLSINLAAILVANLYVMNDMLKALGLRRVQGPRVVPNLRWRSLKKELSVFSAIGKIWSLGYVKPGSVGG